MCLGELPPEAPQKTHTTGRGSVGVFVTDEAAGALDMAAEKVMMGELEENKWRRLGEVKHQSIEGRRRIVMNVESAVRG